MDDAPDLCYPEYLTGFYGKCNSGFGDSPQLFGSSTVVLLAFVDGLRNPVRIRRELRYFHRFGIFRRYIFFFLVGYSYGRDVRTFLRYTRFLLENVKINPFS